MESAGLYTAARVASLGEADLGNRGSGDLAIAGLCSTPKVTGNQDDHRVCVGGEARSADRTSACPAHRLRHCVNEDAIHLDPKYPGFLTGRQPGYREPQTESLVDGTHCQLDFTAAVCDGDQPGDLGSHTRHHEARQVVRLPAILIYPGTGVKGRTTKAGLRELTIPFEQPQPREHAAGRTARPDLPAQRPMRPRQNLNLDFRRTWHTKLPHQGGAPILHIIPLRRQLMVTVAHHRRGGRPGWVVKPSGRVRTLGGMDEGGVDGDERLWRDSLHGEGAAFGVLFDRHGDRVFAYAARLADSRQDAEDITAAAFLELWRRRRDVHLVAGSVLPWLLVTTGNVARNQQRSNRRYRQFLARLPRTEPTPDAADLAFAGMDRVDRDLRTALRSLGQVDLQLFCLVVLKDYSLADAAAAVELTPSAAKSRLHRARHRLRDQLGSPLSATGYPTVGGAR